MITFGVEVIKTAKVQNKNRIIYHFCQTTLPPPFPTSLEAKVILVSLVLKYPLLLYITNFYVKNFKEVFAPVTCLDETFAKAATK